MTRMDEQAGSSIDRPGVDLEGVADDASGRIESISCKALGPFLP